MNAKEINRFFNMVEELVGTYPSSGELRNAIHAIVTKSLPIDKKIGALFIVKNVEGLAKNYEHIRGIKIEVRN
jgi:hypothetical protein